MLCPTEKERLYNAAIFNARTNETNDFIENYELDDYMPINDNYLLDQHLDKRLKLDKASFDSLKASAHSTIFVAGDEDLCRWRRKLAVYGQHILKIFVDLSISNKLDIFLCR